MLGTLSHFIYCEVLRLAVEQRSTFLTF